jgi:drug/metabolite transporter (DMT)-like permease
MPIVEQRRRLTRWLASLLMLQAVVIVVSLVYESVQHESIIFSGPIFALVGVLIAIMAFRERNSAAIIYGCSAVAFALLIVLLINYNRWSPAQGDLPITLLALGYAAVSFPVSFWLLSRRGRKERTA